MRGLNQPKGISFDIADLIYAQSWAEFHDRQMKIWLDHSTNGDEYEEVIAFYAGMNPLTALILWRTTKSIFLQPPLGRKRRYASLAAALDSLLSKEGDIVASAWPRDSG